MKIAPSSHAQSQALIPQFISVRKNPLLLELAALLGGVILLTLLAQVAIPLGFTPVPITGQTFGVMLLALLWGSRRGFLVMSSYLSIGALGFPVFADGASGFGWGPTLGYLLGMYAASVVVGYLSDRGWSRTFWKAYAACAVGSLIVFASGLTVLSFFLPGSFESLLLAGLVPFIPGDIIKTTLAASIASSLKR
jgi:biotin transport system substrate-specific component